jgi:hypothetical protein
MTTADFSSQRWARPRRAQAKARSASGCSSAGNPTAAPAGGPATGPAVGVGNGHACRPMAGPAFAPGNGAASAKPTQIRSSSGSRCTTASADRFPALPHWPTSCPAAASSSARASDSVSQAQSRLNRPRAAARTGLCRRKLCTGPACCGDNWTNDLLPGRAAWSESGRAGPASIS